MACLVTLEIPDNDAGTRAYQAEGGPFLRAQEIDLLGPLPSALSVDCRAATLKHS